MQKRVFFSFFFPEYISILFTILRPFGTRESPLDQRILENSKPGVSRASQLSCFRAASRRVAPRQTAHGTSIFPPFGTSQTNVGRSSPVHKQQTLVFLLAQFLAKICAILLRFFTTNPAPIPLVSSRIYMQIFLHALIHDTGDSVLVACRNKVFQRFSQRFQLPRLSSVFSLQFGY